MIYVRDASVVGALKAGCVYAYVLNGHKVSSGDAGFFSSLYAGDSTIYWAGPALGAVLGTGLFKTAYKGESKKKSKRKTR